MEYIVRAAKILENKNDIVFQILGRGQTYNQVRKIVDELGVQNVHFIEKTDYSELIRYIEASEICLGIFGDTAKATRVIPNKIYDAIALGKPVITADTPAIRELFEDRKNILLCKVADENDLAEKVLELRNNIELRRKIAEGAFVLSKESLQPKMVVRDLLNILEKKSN